MGTLFRDESNIIDEVKRMAEEARPGKAYYTVAYFGAANFDQDPKAWRNAWTMDRRVSWKFAHISLANDQLIIANDQEIAARKTSYENQIENADVILCAGGNAPF